MIPYFFIILTVTACSMAAIAFLSFSKNKSDGRKKLFIGAGLSLIPIIAKMIFSIFPLLEARLMPVEFYTVIQRDFWSPFAVLFFALASHLVSSRSRKGILIIVCILVVVVVQQNFWRLQEPEIYDYKGKITDGVCQQTSFDTCGAASMVTLLTKMGIKTSEGEMSRLAMAAPGKGISPHQAAYALRQKLREIGRSDKAVIIAPDLKDLHDLPTPFLAGIKFSFRTNHMVCIMETTQEKLVVGDPISVGPKEWSWENLGKMWSGIVIVLQDNNTL